MSLVAALAAVGLAVGAGLLAEFLLSCAREGAWRALAIAAAVGVPLFLGGVAAVVLQYPAKPEVTWALLGVEVLLVVALGFPLGGGGGTPVRGAPQRVDERDAVFHRFYRLRPGTPDYEAYYRDHPELQEFDDAVRALPPLGHPGSASHDPQAAPLFQAGFDVTEWISQDLAWEPEPITGERVPIDPHTAARRLTGFARSLGADLAGCTRLDPAWVYSHGARSPGAWGRPIALDHGYAVAVAVEMDHELVRHAPQLPTLTSTAVAYLECAKIAMALARYLTLLGYRARAHVDGNYEVMCVPVAVDAGLGELGRHGLLIAPRIGSRARLAVVTTDLPLAQAPRLDLGARDFCQRCRKCATCCPSRSVDAGDPAVHNGVDKWRSEQDDCYRYWRRCGTDCAVCVKVCPYSHPSSPSHDVVRWAIARNPLARRVALWADDLLYGRRPHRRGPWPGWHERTPR